MMLFIRIPFFCLLSLSLIGTPWGIGETNQRPQELNDASQRSAESKESVDTFANVRSKIRKFLEDSGVPSLAVAVARDGKIVWEEGFGWANREKQNPATHQTVYALASISKVITATGLMVLVERGLVDLNKPANTYLGREKLVAFRGKASDATVKRLLLHRAGLPTHWNLLPKKGAPPRPSMDESISRYGILVIPPGEAYEYSNFGYGILDHIISRASDKPYSDFMKAEVFKPLGMTRTTIGVDAGAVENTACLYDERRKPIPYYDFDHRGASAVFSSAHDLVRFGMFHLKNHLHDQKRILKDETIDAMYHLTDREVTDDNKNLGFASIVDYSGYRMVVHTGGMPGAMSRLSMIPSKKIATVVLSNSDAADLWEIEKLILKAMLPGFTDDPKVEGAESAEKESLTPTPPGPFAGVWEGRMKTYKGYTTVKMMLPESGKISMELNGKTCPFLKRKTPLGKMGFGEDFFKGVFWGRIDTLDASRAPHIIFVHVKRRGNKLTGTAAAVAADKTFCLSNWIELEKVTQRKG